MTPLTITTALLEQSGLVILEGELDLAAAERVPSRFDAVLRSGVEVVVVDLGGVTFMDAAGLSLLLDCREQAAVLGVRCVVAGAGRAVTRVMELTRTGAVELGLAH